MFNNITMSTKNKCKSSKDDNKGIFHEYFESQEQIKAEEEGSEEKWRPRGIWVLLTWLFALTSLVLFITLMCMVALNKHPGNRYPAPCEQNTQHDRSKGRNRRYLECSVPIKTNGSDVFEELTETEIYEVVEFLNSQPDLKLESPDKLSIESNCIHSIEMKLPDKENVLAYLSGRGKKPERMATVYLFRGADDPPTVDEYKVGGIGDKIYAHLLKTDRRQTQVPFIYRPFSTAEFFSIFRYILPQITKRAGHVLKESYDAMPMKCGDKCLKISMAPVASSFIPAGKRKSWFWFQHDIEFSSVRPLDFQFLVDTTSVRPTEWTVEQIWYANQMFPNLTVFLQEYERATYKYNFDTPKVHVFSNYGHISSLGNPRGYRVEIHKMTKQLHPEGYGFEPSVSWARYQMAVTRYRPEEERSSSVFTMWDARSPAVNFI
ncbi:AMO-like protein, partial [Mya arenaria]